MTVARDDSIIDGLRSRPFIPTTWMADAACRDADPAIFFVDHGGSAAEARTICAGCPVQSQCLDYALAANERHGIWSGTTEKQRRTMSRQKGTAT
jgi:WhiB family redox-sensing transcriptional regulator